MTISAIKMTADQFVQLGRDPAGIRLELVDGEVAMSPSSSPEHAQVVHKLSLLIGRYVEERDLGAVLLDVDTFFGEYDVHRPDILFFQSSRRSLITRKRLRGVPDLSVEVISESSADTDRNTKFKQYAKGGVKYYWIIDPEERSFEGYALKSGKYVLTGEGRKNDIIHAEPFKSLAMPLQKLWWRD